MAAAKATESALEYDGLVAWIEAPKLRDMMDRRTPVIPMRRDVIDSSFNMALKVDINTKAGFTLATCISRRLYA